MGEEERGAGGSEMFSIYYYIFIKNINIYVENIHPRPPPPTFVDKF